nr:peptide-methionine (R)-S-oxide reductase MsrB [Parvularcula bermudensis]
MNQLTRRSVLLGGSAALTVACTGRDSKAQEAAMSPSSPSEINDDTDWAELSEAAWKDRLTAEEFRVLRKEGTERAGTSPLNAEKREGTYVCAGCALPLFLSSHKFESGTGWPSFFDVIDGAVDTKTDFKLIVPRTEYHCSRCGGHQGHVFKDGPQPTGLRYCNNGVALDFVPAESA